MPPVAFGAGAAIALAAATRAATSTTLRNMSRFMDGISFELVLTATEVEPRPRIDLSGLYARRIWLCQLRREHVLPSPHPIGHVWVYSSRADREVRERLDRRWRALRSLAQGP